MSLSPEQVYASIASRSPTWRSVLPREPWVDRSSGAARPWHGIQW